MGTVKRVATFALSCGMVMTFAPQGSLSITEAAMWPSRTQPEISETMDHENEKFD